MSSQVAVLEKPMPIRSKQKSKHKERMICTVCLKPGAIRYLYPKRKQIIYLHRDEPPIGEKIYGGKKFKVYRRCSATIKDESLQSLIERPISQSKIMTKTKPKPKPKKIPILSDTDLDRAFQMARDLYIYLGNERAKRREPNAKPYINAPLRRTQ